MILKEDVHFEDKRKCRIQGEVLLLQKQTRLSHGSQAMILGTQLEK